MIPGVDQEMLRYHLAVAGEVKSWMGRRGMQQKHLAALIGLSGVAVSRRLSGHTAFTLFDLMRIAEVVGCDLDDLLPAHPRFSPMKGVTNDNVRRLFYDNREERLPAVLAHVNGADQVAGAGGVYAIRDSNPEPADLKHFAGDDVLAVAA